MPQGQETPNQNKVLVALGSNAASHAGGPYETVFAAAEVLRQKFHDVTVSGFYQTPAFPASSGPDFVNAACMFDSDAAAPDILTALHDIEAAFERERTQRWGPRTLDLDLIAHGQRCLPDNATFTHWRTLPLDAQKTTAPETLILPHPRLQDRAFVLMPLVDVAPDWRHPVLDRSVAEMLADLPDAARAEITRL